MKIAIDPGHGMSNATPGVFDPGAVAREAGETFREADMVLRYGLALKDVLRTRGVEVFMTRDDHEDRAPVGERAGNAERAGCDVFVSLHMNAFEAPSANGLEVLFRDNADAAFAKAMHDSLVEVTGLRPRGTPQRTNLAVLRFDGPAVLIELGFISNTRDRTELLNPVMRASVCAKIADVVLERFGVGASAAMAAGSQRVATSAPYVLPAYARARFGEGSGIPWSSASAFPDFNFYSGIVRGSFHRFPATGQLPSGALFYEAKFAIDGDGSGGNDAGDVTHQPDTSLHDAQGRPLNSRVFPFIVLPLRHNKPGRPQWSDLGVELGDLGVCFYKNGTSCAVLFGDRGPAAKLGEGSMLAAEMLGIDSDPNVGGIGPSEVPPGVLHFVFPGSRKVRPVPHGRPRTDDTAQSVTERAWELWEKLGGAAHASLGRSAGVFLPAASPTGTMRAQVMGGEVVSLNLMETLQHAGQAKVIVKLAQPGSAAALGVSLGGRRQIEADLASMFVAANAEETASLVAACNAGPGGRSGPARVPRVHVFPRLGLAVGTVTAEGAASLARHPGVEEVVKAPDLSLIRPIGGRAARASAATTTWGLKRLRVKELWTRGHRGQGVLIGHLDTGIDGRHPALKPAIHEFAEFDLLARKVPGAIAKDSADHGTHTAGTIAGRTVRGVEIGVAPDAKLLSGMVIEGGQVIERILAGMEWIVEQDGRILSMSLGLRGFTTAFEVVMQSLRDAGVLPVVAVGNEFANTSRSPGNYATVLSVGACDEAQRVAAFSSSQTFARPDDPVVPDIVAPGVEVLSCAVGGGYRFDSGTSMATPHVAGLAALLLSAKPDATVTELEQAILRACVRPATMPSSRANRGVPDAVIALEALLGHPLEAVVERPTRPRQAKRPARKPSGNGVSERHVEKGRRMAARRASQGARAAE